MINDFKQYVKNHYECKKSDAGYGGEHHDGGYREAMAIISANELGLEGLDLTHVKGFQSLIPEFNMQKDPEYAEYLRLQEKFE